MEKGWERRRKAGSWTKHRPRKEVNDATGASFLDDKHAVNGTGSISSQWRVRLGFLRNIGDARGGIEQPRALRGAAVVSCIAIDPPALM